MNKRGDLAETIRALGGIALGIAALVFVLVVFFAVIKPFFFEADPEQDLLHSFDGFRIALGELEGDSDYLFTFKKGWSLVAFDADEGSGSAGTSGHFIRPTSCFNKACIVLCKDEGDEDDCVDSKYIIKLDDITNFEVGSPAGQEYSLIYPEDLKQSKDEYRTIYFRKIDDTLEIGVETAQEYLEQAEGDLEQIKANLDPETLASYESLVDWIRTLLAVGTSGANSGDLRLKIADDYVIVGFDKNWNEFLTWSEAIRKHSNKDTDGPVAKPYKCDNKACICLYKGDIEEYVYGGDIAENSPARINENVALCEVFDENLIFNIGEMECTKGDEQGVERGGINFDEDVAETLGVNIKVDRHYLFLYGEMDADFKLEQYSPSEDESIISLYKPVDTLCAGDALCGENFCGIEDGNDIFCCGTKSKSSQGYCCICTLEPPVYRIDITECTARGYSPRQPISTLNYVNSNVDITGQYGCSGCVKGN